jgi:nucleotide-binding universal stress UspA family protein
MSENQVCPIPRLEKILLATDGSNASSGAIRESFILAKACNSELYIISVVEVPEIIGSYPAAAEKLEIETREHLESLKSKAEKEGLVCHIIQKRAEQVFQIIIDEAKKNKVGLIMMGRLGRTELKRVLMGGVAAKVIGHAPCLAMVVPRSAQVNFKKILIATDGSVVSEIASRQAIAIAKAYGTDLVVLSVAKKDANLSEAELSVDMVRQAAEREKINVEAFTMQGEPYEVILKTAEQKNVGLIITGSHGRTGLERVLMGSVAERVIGHSKHAVLVVTKITESTV